MSSHFDMVKLPWSGGRWIGLTPDATTLADRLFVHGHRAFANEDLRRDDLIPLSSSQSPEAGPSPREGAVGVYARSSGEVFVVGGSDPVTGESLGDIWWRDVADGGTWRSVPLDSYRPGRVLAATRSYSDRKLWVLDEVRSGVVNPVKYGL